MSIEEKRREAFEVWHRSVVEGEPPHEKYSSGGYRNQHVQRYWLGWNAALDSVVIELPDIKNTFYPSTTERARAEEAVWWCKNNIESAGLKVKS